MNRGFQNIDIVKANLKSIDDFEKGNKHIEFKTITRNGKTFVQRYNLKNIEQELEKNNTPLKAGAIDKVFNSFYHDGKFIDSEGKVIDVSDDFKAVAKTLNFESWRKEFETKILEGKGKSPEEIAKTIRDTNKSRMEEFKKVKEKYEVHKEKQNKWLDKNKTRLTNQYNAIYAPESRLKRVEESVDKITKDSSLDDINKLLKYVIGTETGDALNDKHLTYDFEGKNYLTTVGKFKSSIENRISSGADKNKKLNIQNFKIHDIDLSNIGKRSGDKTLDEYLDSAVFTADKEGRIK